MRKATNSLIAAVGLTISLETVGKLTQRQREDLSNAIGPLMKLQAKCNEDDAFAQSACDYDERIASALKHVPLAELPTVLSKDELLAFHVYTLG